MTRTSTFVAMTAAGLVLNIFVYSQTAGEPSRSPLAEAAQVIGVMTSIGIFLIFLIGLVYFVWKGKDIEALTKRVAALRDDNEDLRTKNAELKAEIAEEKAAKLAREREAEELRKANLRLQGIKDA